MKIILVGYPGSYQLRKVSKYLSKKYLPGFKVKYLCHKGPIEMWAKFIASFLRQLKDPYVIMALDDYLLNSTLKKEVVDDMVALMIKKNAVVLKLCDCTPAENVEYPVTTQYCIWNRQYLISLLDKITTPWDFELKGSKIFREQGMGFLWYPALHYHTNSALSSRWPGINFKGLKGADMEYIVNQKLL